MTNLIHALMLLAQVLALESARAHELLLGSAAVVTVLGMWLCWGAHGYRMSLEERVKDGEISDHEASRKIRQSQWTGPLVTVIGVALLLYWVFD